MDENTSWIIEVGVMALMFLGFIGILALMVIMGPPCPI